MRKLPLIVLASFAGGLTAALVFTLPVGVRAGSGSAPTDKNGDANGDGVLDIADAVHVLMFLFKGGPEPVALADSPELLARVAAVEARLAGAESALAEKSEALTALQAKVEELRGLTEDEAGILTHFSIVHLPVDNEGNTAKTIRITGANLQIVSSERQGPQPDGTGLGNLLLGHNRVRTHSADDEDIEIDTRRTGTHNIVVGSKNNYTGTGGLVMGDYCESSGAYCSVISAQFSQASGNYSATLGSMGCLANGNFCAVAAGSECYATGTYSAFLGGNQN